MVTRLIKLLTELPSGWDDLVATSPGGTFYQSSVNLELIKTLSGAAARFLVLEEAGNLLAGLAFAQISGPLGFVVNSLPYYGSYGEALVSPGAPAGSEAALYAALLDYCREVDALSLTVITSPFTPPSSHDSIGQTLGATFTDRRFCHATPLPEAAGDTFEAYFERVFSLVESSARRAYRKATQCDLTGLSLAEPVAIARFAAVHQENIGGKGGLYKSNMFFDLVRRFSAERRGGADIAAVYAGTDFAGGVVFFEFRQFGEYHTVALTKEYRHARPLNKVIIDKMARCGHGGARWMNFGGTWRSQDGVRKFKESFGAVELPYSYHTVFFRDLDRVRALTSAEVLAAYPHTFVIPFSELA